MPRWAEMVVIGVIGVVLFGALMVFAKYKLQSNAPPPGPATATAPAATEPPADDSKATPEKETTSLQDLEAAAAEAVSATSVSPPPTESTPQPAPVPTVAPTAVAEPGPAAPAAEATVAPPADPAVALETDTVGEAPGTEGVAAPAVPDGVDEAKAKEGLEKRKQPVKPGSREELLLLAEAERTLRRLKGLRLRTDIPPAAREQVQARLDAIMDRLPDESRKEMEAWIAQSQPRDERPAGEPVEAGEASTITNEIDDRKLGTDDTPAAERNVKNKVDKLSSQLGVKRPNTTPPSYGKVNPTILPAAKAPTTTNLPSTQAKGLD